jgi:hypothetical protein
MNRAKKQINSKRNQMNSLNLKLNYRLIPTQQRENTTKLKFILNDWFPQLVQRSDHSIYESEELSY